MSFSVVIPTLNEAKTVADAITSAWKADAAEVIVSDGGSTDDTQAIAERNHARVVPSNPGRGTQLNTGAKFATQNILIFLHADNRLSPDCGHQVRQAFDSGAQFCCFRQRIENQRSIFRWIERGNALRATVQRLPYGDQGITISRTLFDRINGFESIPLMEDVVFSKRVSKLERPRLLAGPIFVSDRRWKENGVLRQTFNNWLTMVRYRLGASPEELAASYYGNQHQCNQYQKLENSSDPGERNQPNSVKANQPLEKRSLPNLK